MKISTIDLTRDIVILTTGEEVPITNYVGGCVVAGPTSEGTWISSMITEDDVEDAEAK
jgi:hypothetical protein